MTIAMLRKKKNRNKVSENINLQFFASSLPESINNLTIVAAVVVLIILI